MSTRSTTVLTGEIWQTPPRRRSQIVRRVCERLEATYGQPRLGNPKKPLDDLVYIILSNKTSPTTARRVYDAVKKRFKSWDAMLRARNSTVESILKPAGLSKIKSAQLRGALRSIARDFGRCSLNDLSKWPQAEAECYLTSLPGVSEKVAKCVMIYTLGAQVLPVDGHVHRISNRLGWTARKRADQCHDELEPLVPPARRYAFHVDCIAHGRKLCRPANPICKNCCIQRYCRYNQCNG